MQKPSISYSWKKPDASRGFTSGVSLHGHTSMSKESLSYLAHIGDNFKVLRPIIANRERHTRKAHGLQLDFNASYWTPPLNPRMAFDLERRQIEDLLDLPAMVSLTDHDNIDAPLLLRSVPTTQPIPISVEWTVPFRESVFHLGIHNLPANSATEWMQTLQDFTAEPNLPVLTEILSSLHALPGALIIFNHPMWDFHKLGLERHMACVNEFLVPNNQFLHAFELNGLRSWHENRQAFDLARKWNQLLISGGDRHGSHPNANTNLTHATNFEEFVHEVRNERISHVLFMPQYADPIKFRILESTLDVIRYYADFPEGTRYWDDRVFHPDANGVPRPISQLWPKNRAPRYISGVMGTTRLLGRRPISSSLRLAWNDRQALRNALEA